MPVSLTDPDARKWDVELAGDLGQSGGGYCLVCRYRGHGETNWIPLAAIDFHPKSLGVQDCVPRADTWITNARMGLKTGERVGSGGLHVRVFAPIVEGYVCEGQQFRLRVECSEDAWVRLYSVADDGTALLGWASTKPLSKWEPDDLAVAIRLPRDQRYRLVALAVPARLGRDAFGSSLPPAGCLSPPGTGLDASALPREGAAAALTFSVHAPGEHGCPDDEETVDRAASLLRALDRLERCESP